MENKLPRLISSKQTGREMSNFQSIPLRLPLHATPPQLYQFGCLWFCLYRYKYMYHNNHRHNRITADVCLLQSLPLPLYALSLPPPHSTTCVFPMGANCFFIHITFFSSIVRVAANNRLNATHVSYTTCKTYLQAHV